jgi:hypothetical protein
MPAASVAPLASPGPQDVDPTIVPWADLPAGAPETPTPLPRPAIDASVPLCRADQLAARLDSRDGASGTLFYFVAMRRISGDPCRLDMPLIGLSAASPTGRQQLPINEWLQPTRWVEPVVLRAPADQGRVTLSAYARCDDASQQRRPLATDLELALESGAVRVTGSAENHGIELGCLAPTAPIGVSRIGGQLAETTYPHDPRTDLLVSLQVPPTATAGALLEYTVTLTNPTDHDIALEPCPTFIQHGDAGYKDPHQLNCAAARPVRGHDCERFAMQVAVPASAPLGQSRVWWEIATVNGSTASAEVDIVAL